MNCPSKSICVCENIRFSANDNPNQALIQHQGAVPGIQDNPFDFFCFQGCFKQLSDICEKGGHDTSASF